MKILHVEESQLNDKATRRLIRGVRKMDSLKELHLVNITKLESHMHMLADSVRNHKALEVLDVRQTNSTNLYKRDVSSLVVMLAENT